MTTFIHAPDGDVGAPAERLAPAVPALGGLRVGVLDNGKPNARDLLVRVAEGLVARTGARLSLVVGKATAATPCEPDVLARLRDECDVVLTGSAD